MSETSERHCWASCGRRSPRLRTVTASEQVAPLLKGGWSRKQVVGHLIDSASNNHQRFVRAALQPSIEFHGYQQYDNVRLKATLEAAWDLLVDLWVAYNRYLAHIIARVPQAKLETPLPDWRWPACDARVFD